MEKMLGNKKYILIFILPALLLFLGFTLIPLRQEFTVFLNTMELEQKPLLV